MSNEPCWHFLVISFKECNLTGGVTAIYAKILHDPVLQESQKKFWLFKHNFRALDLTWSDYVIVNKSTCVTCFYFLLWMKSTKCRNIADCNIFALLWITALSWSNIFASKLLMLPIFVFQEENLCHDKKAQNIWVKMSTRL